MNAFQRQMKLQGSEHSLSANGRRFVVGFEKRDGKRIRVLSEVLSEGDGCISYFNGFWRGQPRLGFATLDGAGEWRRIAMRERDEFRRKGFMRKCREAIQDSKSFRETAEQVERCRVIYSEAA